MGATRDLQAARLHVRQAADDENVLHPPKSGKPRIIELPRKVVRQLRGHKHLRGPFVFCHEDGSMLCNRDCESKSTQERHDGPLVKVCRKAGLRRIGWHVLRHTYASHLMMKGAKPVEVQELLGHASLSMTMRYTHLSPSARRAAAELLDDEPPERRKDDADEEGAEGESLLAMATAACALGHGPKAHAAFRKLVGKALRSEAMAACRDSKVDVTSTVEGYTGPELLAQARAALADDDAKTAFDKAHASNKVERSSEPVLVKGLAACTLGDGEQAERLLPHVGVKSRPRLVEGCREAGVELRE